MVAYTKPTYRPLLTSDCTPLYLGLFYTCTSYLQLTAPYWWDYRTHILLTADILMTYSLQNLGRASPALRREDNLQFNHTEGGNLDS